MTNYPPPPSSMPPPPGCGAPMSAPPSAPAGPRQYGTFAAMALAPFASGALYRDVARSWRGIAFGALFLTLLITWAVSMVRVHVAIKAFGRDEFPKVVKDVPPITIKDGVASSPVDQPYEMKDKDTGEVFAVLDTTGKVNSLDDTSAHLLLTQDKLFMRDANGNSVREYPLKEVKNFYLDSAKIQGWFDKFAPMFAPIAFIPAVVGSLIYRLVQMLLYALLGMAFAGGFGARLSYAALCRLAVLAIVPVLILQTIVEFIPLPFQIWGLVWLAVAMLYLAMAVRANRMEPSENSR